MYRKICDTGKHSCSHKHLPEAVIEPTTSDAADQYCCTIRSSNIKVSIFSPSLKAHCLYQMMSISFRNYTSLEFPQPSAKRKYGRFSDFWSKSKEKSPAGIYRHRNYFNNKVQVIFLVIYGQLKCH